MDCKLSFMCGCANKYWKAVSRFWVGYSYGADTADDPLQSRLGEPNENESMAVDARQVSSTIALLYVLHAT